MTKDWRTPINPHSPANCCANCHFSKAKPPSIVCQRYPPSPNGGALGVYPWTHPKEWCGEWAALSVEDDAVSKSAERVRYLKTGGEYEVVGEAEAQVSEGMKRYGVPGAIRLISDDDRLTVYRCVETGKLWIRFTDEFRDGRFKTISQAQP